MEYVEERPPPPLSRFVECFWFLRGRESPASPGVERIFPDGCIEIIVHLAEPFRSLAPGGEAQPQPVSFLVGELTRFLLLQPPRRVATMGIRFRPGRAFPFVRLPLDELADRVVPLDALWGTSGRRLEEELLEAASDRERTRVATRFLLARLAGSPKADGAVEAAVQAILERRGRVGIAGLSGEVGLSERQLQRLFDERVGLGPKTLARIVRFQSVLALLGPERALAWATIAAECGFSDQAHLVRELKSLTGVTPGELLCEARGLSRAFTSSERMAAFFGAGS